MLRCMRSRRRSRKRYSRRRSSFTPSSALIVKGAGGATQHLDLGGLDLDLAGGELRVDVVGAAREDLAVDPDDGLLGQLARASLAGVPGRATSCVIP